MRLAGERQRAAPHARLVSPTRRVGPDPELRGPRAARDAKVTASGMSPSASAASCGAGRDLTSQGDTDEQEQFTTRYPARRQRLDGGGRRRHANGPGPGPAASGDAGPGACPRRWPRPAASRTSSSSWATTSAGSTSAPTTGASCPARRRTSTSWRRRACGSPTTTPRRAARRAAPTSSPARFRSAPA